MSQRLPRLKPMPLPTLRFCGCWHLQKCLPPRVSTSTDPLSSSSSRVNASRYVVSMAEKIAAIGTLYNFARLTALLYGFLLPVSHIAIVDNATFSFRETSFRLKFTFSRSCLKFFCIFSPPFITFRVYMLILSLTVIGVNTKNRIQSFFQSNAHLEN